MLASGVQEGGTGNTDVIMRTPWTRDAPLFDLEGTGSWLTTLELAEPTLVEVVAEGSLGFEESAQRGSRTLLLVPGRAVAESVLTFAGETSVYSGQLTPPEPGACELQVLALDPVRADSGMARRGVTVLY